MGGRPPTPTALKALHGFPGRRPPPENEPRPDVYLPEAPEWLNKLSKEIFKNKAKELYEVKILTQLDTETLAIWADMMGQYVTLRQQIEKEGMVFYKQKVDFQGNERLEPARNPNMVTIEYLRREIRQYSDMLGTNPRARVRLQVIEVPNDPFEDFLSEK